MKLECAYCRRPLERLNTLESEIGDDVREKIEYMCTNINCEYSSRVIYEWKRPLEKKGYITIAMLNRREPPKSRLRRLFGGFADQLSARL
jgi:lipopolysaccharide biosynthesis regulator YciM